VDYRRAAVLAILLVVLYVVARVLHPFLPALVWAAILATVFYPLFQRMARLLRRPPLASGVTCLLLTLAFVLPILLLLSLLAGESASAYRMLEARIKPGGAGELAQLRNAPAFQWVLAKLQEFGLPEPNLADAGMRALRGVSEFLVSHSASVFSGFIHFALNFFVMIFGVYYLFLNGPTVLREIRGLSPLRREHEERIIEKFRGIARATFMGSLATALIQGTAGGLVFLFFGLSSPLLWGAVMAFLSLVPVVGTALIWGPVAVYYFLTGVAWKGVLLLVIFVGVVGVVDNVVKPLIIRGGTEIHTIWIFLSILGGVGVFGFLGFVLGPFFVTLLFVGAEIYRVEFGKELGKDAAP